MQGYGNAVPWRFVGLCVHPNCSPNILDLSPSLTCQAPPKTWELNSGFPTRFFYPKLKTTSPHLPSTLEALTLEAPIKAKNPRSLAARGFISTSSVTRSRSSATSRIYWGIRGSGPKGFRVLGFGSTGFGAWEFGELRCFMGVGSLFYWLRKRKP